MYVSVWQIWNSFNVLKEVPTINFNIFAEDQWNVRFNYTFEGLELKFLTMSYSNVCYHFIHYCDVWAEKIY